MSATSGANSFEAQWARVKLLLEWQQGFGFYLVFGEDQRTVNQLKQRVEDATRLRTRSLQWVKPTSPATAAEEVLQAAFTEQEHYQQWKAPLWIELTAGPADPDWIQARRNTLAALNRRRSALEQECQRPMFLHLPLSTAPEIVTYAPDLWSVRKHIVQLSAYDETAPGVVHPELLRDRSTNLANLGDEQAATGNLEHALRAYRESLEIDRQLRSSLGDTPQALRDLSISLDNVGKVQGESGNASGALAAFEESLALSRQLRSSLGDTPQALRDLSVSLNKVGDVQRASGNVSAALVAFEESLALRRQLRSSLGDTPQALRDLSVSLERVGDVQRESGNVSAALVAFEESLALRRQLRSSLGDTPQALRDVVISLGLVSAAERHAGNVGVADALEAEKQAIEEQLNAAGF
jgi:tetratricopeptide (TPR) repeat protein